eukprot:scaffold48949_cov60-Attheya_sp.AAC.2
MHGRYHSTSAVQHPIAAPTPATVTVTSPSLTAGLHNGHDVQLGGVNGPRPTTATSGLTPLYPNGPMPTLQVESVYGTIMVSDPVLVQNGGLIGGIRCPTRVHHYLSLVSNVCPERWGVKGGLCPMRYCIGDLLGAERGQEQGAQSGATNMFTAGQTLRKVCHYSCMTVIQEVVLTALVKCFWTASTVRPGQDLNAPRLIAFIHVDWTGDVVCPKSMSHIPVVTFRSR